MQPTTTSHFTASQQQSVVIAYVITLKGHSKSCEFYPTTDFTTSCKNTINTISLKVYYTLTNRE